MRMSLTCPWSITSVRLAQLYCCIRVRWPGRPPRSFGPWPDWGPRSALCVRTESDQANATTSAASTDRTSSGPPSRRSRSELRLVVAVGSPDAVVGVAKVILGDIGLAVVRLEDQILFEDECAELPSRG